LSREAARPLGLWEVVPERMELKSLVAKRVPPDITDRGNAGVFVGDAFLESDPIMRDPSSDPEDAPDGEVVKAARNVGQTVGDHFMVAPAVAGIDAVARIEGTEQGQPRIGVVK
jgi:hypothetical protein